MIWDIRGAPRIRDHLGRMEIGVEVRRGKLGVFHLVRFNEKGHAILFVDVIKDEEPRCDGGGSPTRWDVRCATGTPVVDGWDL